MAGHGQGSRAGSARPRPGARGARRSSRVRTACWPGGSGGGEAAFAAAAAAAGRVVLGMTLLAG